MVGPGVSLGSVVARRYRLDRQLGEGGFGAVYIATRLDNAEQVALKVLSDHALERVGGDARFRREAELARRLQHPNIVKVLDEGIDEAGVRYIAFELLRGRSLAEELTRWGAMAPRRAGQIGLTVLDALEQAHRLGVVHRDLKPANIFLCDGNDLVKVLDYGIAKSTNPGTIAGLTQAGQVLGTPAYMAVEQLTGAEVTPCTDLFALGVVLLQMVMGRIPYPNESTAMDIVRDRLTGQAVPIPPEIMRTPLGPFLARATANEPGHRFQSAGEMKAALHAVLSTPTFSDASYGSYGGPLAHMPTGAPPAPMPAAPPVQQHSRATAPQEAGWAPPPPTPYPVAAYQPPPQPTAKGSGVGAVALVVLLVAALAVAGVGIGIWMRTSSPATADNDDAGESDEEEEEDDDPKPKPAQPKPKPPVPPTLPASTPTVPVVPTPFIPPPPGPPPPPTSRVRTQACKGAAGQSKSTLSSVMSSLGWSITGDLLYCAGDMVNFRCSGGEGRGLTAKLGGIEGSAAPIRFASPKEAADFVATQAGKPGTATLATDGAVVLRLDMPDAEADKVLARVCR